jgi:hypothetical protein
MVCSRVLVTQVNYATIASWGKVRSYSPLTIKDGDPKAGAGLSEKATHGRISLSPAVKIK